MVDCFSKNIIDVTLIVHDGISFSTKGIYVDKGQNAHDIVTNYEQRNEGQDVLAVIYAHHSLVDVINPD